MSIAKETRRAAYDQVLLTLGPRQEAVYNFLQFFPEGITANELALRMHEEGYFPTSERNNVHPRLNELVSGHRVRITGKRKCTVTGKTCGLYAVIPAEEYQEYLMEMNQQAQAEEIDLFSFANSK